MNFFPPIFDNGFWINFRITRFTHCFFFFFLVECDNGQDKHRFIIIRVRLPFVEEQLKSIFRPKFALVSCPKLSHSIVGDSQKRLDVLKLNYSLRKFDVFTGCREETHFDCTLHLRASCPCCQRIKERRTRNAKRGDVGVFWSVSSHFSS